MSKSEIAEEHVKDSTEKIRQMFFVYLALQAYVLAVVFSTSDKMLLLVNEGIKLPFIDLNVPLFWFYVVIPLFIIAIHVDFLLNLESHQNKLLTWQRALKGSVPREHIPLLLFNLATLDKEGMLKSWVRFASNILCIYSGPITLAVIFWRFSDYQSGLMSLFHGLLFLIDIYFVGKINLAFINNTSPVVVKGKSVLNIVKATVYDSRPQGGWLAISIWYVFLSFIVIEAGIVSWIVNTEDNKFACQYLSTVEKFRENGNGYVMGIMFPNIDIPFNERLVATGKAPAQIQAEEAGEVEMVTKFVRRDASLDLRRRSLRMADLGANILAKVDLSNAKMQGAFLVMTQLRGAYLVGTGLQGANMDTAQLQGSDLRGANLQGAVLAGSKLDDAKLDRAKLGGANIEGLNKDLLKGAVLVPENKECAAFGRNK